MYHNHNYKNNNNNDEKMSEKIYIERKKKRI